MESDAELVKAVFDGRREAYADLVRRYERPVRAAAMAILKDPHAAQDVAQDAFVIGYQKLAGLRDGNAFGGWILRIARRQALRTLGQRTRTRRAAPAVTPAAGNRDGRLDEASEHLLAGVMRLPKHERQTVMLRYFDGYDAETIGRITGRPAGTVRVHLSRALARLRGWLKDFEP